MDPEARNVKKIYIDAKNLPPGLKLDIIKSGRFHVWDEICSFFIGIYEVGPMDEHHKECQECGWQGSAADLDETNDASTGKTQLFCPNCGGKDFDDLNPDEKGQTLEQ